MDLFTALRTRRSIRTFATAEVPDHLIERLLAAAMAAPSAGNQQPWHFIVVRDRRRLDGVARFHPYCQMITKAPVAVVVCGDPEGKKWPDFWVQDCSAAIQNLLLAARGEGLATVWTGVYPVHERVQGCRELFAIPEQVIPLAVIPVGWPEHRQQFKEIERYNPALVHREQFGSR